MAAAMERKVTSSCLSVPSPTSVQKLALVQYFALVKVAYVFFFFSSSLLADVNICSFSTFSGQLASLLFKINIIIDRFDRRAILCSGVEALHSC